MLLIILKKLIMIIFKSNSHVTIFYPPTLLEKQIQKLEYSYNPLLKKLIIIISLYLKN